MAHFKHVIVGGGAMGAATAFFLAKRLGPAGAAQICVVERDFGLTRAASSLAVGGIRYQFSNPLNVQMSQFGREFIRTAPEELGTDVPFHESGYLFLASERGEPILKANNEAQRSVGAPVALMDPTELATRFPWLNVDDIRLGSLGLHDEGWLDPYILTSALRKASRDLGVVHMEAEVNGVELEPGGRRIAAVTVERAGETSSITCDNVVNCAGPWAGAFGAMCGVDVPVVPRLRYVFQFHCPDERYSPSEANPLCPLVVDPTGVYFRGDGDRTFLCGVSPNADDVDEDEPPMEVDHDWFFDRIWPVIAERAPCFENIKVTNSWAGYYDYNTFDQNAFIGSIPAIQNLTLGCGHSGHGIQQAAATGRAVSELLADGDFQTIDLGVFGYERYLAGEQMLERNIV